MARNKARVMETIIAIAGEISPTLGRTIDGVNKQLGGVSDMALAASAAVTAIGSAAVASTKYLSNLGNDYKKAVNSITQATGLVGNELKGFKSAMEDVYKAGYGEDLAEVADGVSTVWKNTGEIGDALTATTKSAYALSEAFEYDIEESTRAARAMIINFGLSGEEAMGLIAAGAQNGLDYSGELIDNISEYSVQFGKLGFTADDMFNIFQEGADSGAWNLDKIGDAVKEFSIRAIDGSKGTVNAYKDLGLNADEMMQTLAAGGDGAKKAFKKITTALMDMDDLVERDAAGVALFGTMWEDLGADAVAAMVGATDAAYDTWGAMDAINSVKYDDIDAVMEGLKRKVEVGLMPAAEKVTNAFIAIAPRIEEMVDKALPHIIALADEVGPLITAAIDLGEKGIKFVAENADILIPIVAALAAGFAVYKAITIAQTVATWAMGSAMTFLTSPIFLVAAAIAAVVAIGVLLYKNWDTVKEKAAQLGTFLSGVWTSLKEGADNLIGGIKEAFVNGFSSLAGVVKGPVNTVIGIVNGAINGINGVGFDIPDWVPKIGGQKFALNIPNIPMLAAGGFTNGVSIAGEAGQEAVISFDSAYRKQNLAYWAQAGRMLGALDEGFSLSGGRGGSYTNLGGVTFAPNIVVQGDARKSDIIEAIRAAYPEFLDLMDELMAERMEAAYGY